MWLKYSRVSRSLGARKMACNAERPDAKFSMLTKRKAVQSSLEIGNNKKTAWKFYVLPFQIRQWLKNTLKMKIWLELYQLS